MLLQNLQQLENTSRINYFIIRTRSGCRVSPRNKSYWGS